MKLANVSWGWTPIPEDMPEGDSLIKIADQIRGLGFEGVDYLGTPEALDEFFTEEACRTLGEHSRSIGLEPNVFVFQDDSWNACCCEKRENRGFLQGKEKTGVSGERAEGEAAQILQKKRDL